MTRSGPRVVVGGVAHLYQGDLDVGRVLIERLQEEDFGPDVLIEDLSYGAVAVAQRLDELRPETLVLVGSAQRGRAPGTVERREPSDLPSTPADVQRSITDAITGYIELDLVLDVAHGLGMLPPATVAIEVEPAQTKPSEQLSTEVEAALDEALELVRREVRQATSSSPRF